ncbi:hypothetical protein L0636_07820 [Halomonas janggokensis]|uniref:hypothetical protein n=1 Tax=Vreelandella janggokensis TaxID=370767 RepID=UPI0022A6D712|nr:hypothetical protein [Halomonas janggokensis]MCZ0930330.1 hypothetical protein [Halomonas janggokensis]
MINTEPRSFKEQIKNYLLTMFFGYITILIIAVLYLTTERDFFCKSIQNMISPNLILLIAAFACIIHFASIFFERLRSVANYYYKHSIDLTLILFGASCSLLTAYYFLDFGMSFNSEVLIKAALVFIGLLLVFCIITLLPYQIFLKIKIDKKNISRSLIHFLSFAFIICLPLAISWITLTQNWSLDDMAICTEPDTAECNEIKSQKPTSIE